MSLQEGLVGHWELDGDTKDSTPYDADGIVNGSPTEVTGIVNGGLDFDGSNDYVDTGVDGRLGFTNSDLTFSAWVYPRGGVFPIFTNYDSNQGYIFRLRFDNNGEPELYFGSNGHAGPTNEFVTNAWQHIAVTYDSANDTVRYYRNGEKIGTVDTSGDSIPTTGDTTRIGYYTAGSDFYADGRIDDVRAYDRVLSDSEVNQVSQIRNKRSTTNDLYKGLVGYWPLDSLEALDSSAYSNHGTDQGNSTETTGQVGNALEFNGTGEGVTIPDSSVLKQDNFTMMAWVKTNDTTTTQQIYRAAGSGLNYGFALAVLDSGNLQFAVSGQNNTKTVQSSLNDTDWHHVAGVVDQGNVEFFVDGQSAGTNTITTPLIFNNEKSRIGSAVDGIIPFDGKIDDVRLYREPKAQSFIQQIIEQRAQQVQQL